MHELVYLHVLSTKSALSAGQNFRCKFQQDSHEVCTQYQYVPAWNQNVPENVQSCTAMYCHVLPCTAMYCQKYALVRTSTYFESFVRTGMYLYVLPCENLPKVHTSICTTRVQGGTYQYIQVHTLCTAIHRDSRWR